MSVAGPTIRRVSDQVLNAVVATVLGSVLAVLLLAPVAAREYRRDGRLGPDDLALLVSGAIYALAVWTYTLLPMPAGDHVCVGRQTTPFATIREIRPAPGDSLVTLVHDPAFLQVALNVLLFVPLGFYVRRLLGQGVLVATVVGLALSLAVETTQVTGVWGLYDCAYRVFDVDDLLVNTAGAAVGSLLSALVVRRHDEPAALPTSISLGRRWIGMASDVLFVVVVGAAAGTAFRAWHLHVLHRPVEEIDLAAQAAVQWGIPGIVEAALVLGSGRTVGEWVVAVRTRPRGQIPVGWARALKFALGVGPFVVLGWASPDWALLAMLAHAALTAAAAVPGREHRGLANAAAGLDLEVAQDREEVSARTG